MGRRRGETEKQPKTLQLEDNKRGDGCTGGGGGGKMYFFFGPLSFLLADKSKGQGKPNQGPTLS